MKILLHYVYKSSLNKVSNIRILFILFSLYLILKIECWPVFKQDPKLFYLNIDMHKC